MSAFRKALEVAGLSGAKTHLQSGNLILSTDQSSEELRSTLASVLAGEFGLHDVPIMVLETRELAAELERCPFDGDPSQILAFFADGKVAAMDFSHDDWAQKRTNERICIGERAVWFTFPDGVSRSKLAANLLRRTDLTSRNLKTVRAVLSLGQTL